MMLLILLTNRVFVKKVKAQNETSKDEVIDPIDE